MQMFTAYAPAPRRLPTFVRCLGPRQSQGNKVAGQGTISSAWRLLLY